MSAPLQFRKKPVVIEAMKFGPTPTDAHNLTSWMEHNLYPWLVGNALEPASLRYHDQVEGDDSTPDKGIYIDPVDGALMIRTLEGDMRTSGGDYVIRGMQGEFYPCKPDIFEATYEAVWPSIVDVRLTSAESTLVPTRTTSTVYAEIRAERERQIAKGWSAEHDDEHGLIHLAVELHRRSGKVRLGDGEAERAREQLVEVAAMAVAAIELTDRRGPVDRG